MTKLSLLPPVNIINMHKMSPLNIYLQDVVVAINASHGKCGKNQVNCHFLSDSIISDAKYSTQQVAEKI